LQVAEPPDPQHPPAQQLDPQAEGSRDGQAQLPPWQVFGAVQALPQVPQFALSDATGVQVPPQQSSPAAQARPTHPPQ
jgi:hypothetical protein